jgi:type VI secretion system protein ImpL
LEAQRTTLLELDRHEQHGAPVFYRFGLYVGADLRKHARRIYFDHYRTVLLTPIQDYLAASLHKVPDKPEPQYEYDSIYDSLRAYLITTSDPDKSSVKFLVPALVNAAKVKLHLSTDKGPSAEQQFNYYAEQIKRDTTRPFTVERDEEAVAKARVFLLASLDEEKVYAQIISEASRHLKDVTFNRHAVQRSGKIVNAQRVEAAYTKEAQQRIEAILKATRGRRAEGWVLGDNRSISNNLDERLLERYRNDYRRKWLQFLQNTSVSDCARPSNSSLNMLGQLCLVSNHTSVGDTVISNEFRAVHEMVPPERCRGGQLVNERNRQYMDTLSALQIFMETAARPQSESAADQFQTQLGTFEGGRLRLRRVWRLG